MIRKDVLTAIAWGVGLTALTALSIIVGSRSLDHFDAALIAYTFATLFAVFGITYRYVIWLQRPPTQLYWRRGWQTFFTPSYWARNVRLFFSRATTDFALNQFIRHRSRARWAAHMLLMWGCVISFAITIPLVFGWLHFESVPDRLDWYQVSFFGFALMSFPATSVFAFMIFHGLVWSALLVIAGVMLAFLRRMTDKGAAALQSIGEDIVPLLLLFGVSITGLMITVSYTWLHGYAYSFLAIAHAAVTILMLIYLPFGKFFHIFQRPAQLGVYFYKEHGRHSEPALCRRCGQPFSSRQHVEDLIEVERKLGYQYEMDDPRVAHYQWICPRCRRASIAMAQSKAWQQARGDTRPVIPAAAGTLPEPTLALPAIGAGPLGEEDLTNFHT